MTGVQTCALPIFIVGVVLRQDGDMRVHDGAYSIMAGAAPAIEKSGKVLYVRGEDHRRDNDFFFHTYPTNTDAIDAYAAFAKLVSKINVTAQRHATDILDFNIME